MPVAVGGEKYFTQQEVAELLNTTRQTIWRWRKDGVIPAGRRYRDKQILFSPAELEEIRLHADRLVPDIGVDRSQLPLFGTNGQVDV